LQVDLLLTILDGEGPATVVELGVGSGRIAEAILDRLPAARVVGVDSSPAMLALAEQRLRPFGGRASLVLGDLTQPERIELPARFDAAVSVQALHHLDDDAKARVFRWLPQALAPRGLMLLRDKVTVSPLLFPAYRSLWLRQPVPMADTIEAYEESLVRKGDRPASLERHLAWLRDGGFEPAVLHAAAHYVLIAARA
jgi:SAM-dependent methyltransferase